MCGAHTHTHTYTHTHTAAARTSPGQNVRKNLAPPVSQLMYSSLSSSSESEDVVGRKARLARAGEESSPTCVSELCPSSSSGLPNSDRLSRKRSPSMVTLQGYAGAVVAMNQGDLVTDGAVGSKFFTRTVGGGHLKSLLEYGAVACGSVKEFLTHLPRDTPAKHWLDLC